MTFFVTKKKGCKNQPSFKIAKNMLGGLNILNLGVNLALLKVQLTKAQWITNLPDLPRIRMAPYGLESADGPSFFKANKSTRD